MNEGLCERDESENRGIEGVRNVRPATIVSRTGKKRDGNENECVRGSVVSEGR